MSGTKTTRRSFLSALSGLTLGRLAGSVSASETNRAPSGFGRLDGAVFSRGALDYESNRLRAVWQAIKPDRFPAHIVRVGSEADVVEALRYANQHGLKVAVRGGGHSYVGNSLRNDSLLIDLSALRDILIDRAARQVEAGPGVASVSLAAALSEERLAFPVAHCPSVPLGGYLLGGGMGWNGEAWGGFACFNVRAVDVITAEGTRVTASEDHHPDLFWLARGAGPAFSGVVTRFYLQAFELPAAITRSAYVYSFDALDALSEWAERYRARQDRKMELTFIFSTNEEAPAPAERSAKQCILSAVCFSDEQNEATALLEALAEDLPQTGRISARERQASGFVELLALSKASAPIRQAVDTIWSSRPREVLLEVGRHFLDVPSPYTHVIANLRADPVLNQAGACSLVLPLFMLATSAWQDAAADARNFAWQEQLMERLEPFTHGHYINEIDFQRRPGRAERSFSKAAWRNIAQVRQTYDPGNRFVSPFDFR